MYKSGQTAPNGPSTVFHISIRQVLAPTRRKLLAAIARIEVWRLRRHTVWTLRSFDDRMLRDIGICRGNIGSAATEAASLRAASNDNTGRRATCA